MTNENLNVIKGRGFKAFEKLRAEGKIETEDIVISPYYDIFLGRRDRHVRHTAVTDPTYYLVECEDPHNLNSSHGGYFGYKLALERRPWAVIKSAQIPQLQQIGIGKRGKLYK